MSHPAPRAQRLTAEELAEMVSAQPALFALPPVEDRELQRSAARFSGKISTKDDVRCAEIARRWLVGESQRQIAEAVGCSRNTVPVVLRELERQGKLEPLKDLVLRDLGEAVREQVAWNKDLIAAREVSSEAAAILKAGWVGAGVFLDKVSGPQIHLHAHEHRVAPVGEDLAKRYAEQLRTLSADVESGGDALISNCLRGADTPDDTAGAVVEVSAVVGSGSGGSAASAAGQGADTPGGGSRSGAGVGEDDGN